MSKRFILIIITVLSLAISACGPKDERLYKNGKDLYKVKDYEGSINKFLELIELNEDYVKAYFNLAVLYTKVDPQDYENSAIYIKKAIEKAEELGLPDKKITKYQKIAKKIVKGYFENVVKEDDSLEAYENFVEEYPDYPGNSDIILKMEEKKFEVVKTEDTIEAYETFIEANPESKFVYNSESAIYNKLIDQNDEATMKEYIDAHPDFKFKKEIVGKLSQTAYENVMEIEDAGKKAEALGKFIEEYPESELVSQAQEKLYEIAWDAAKADGSADAYMEFAEKHPDSKYAKDAKNSADMLSFKKAKTDASLQTDIDTKIKIFNRFIENNPENSNVRKAESIISGLKDRIKEKEREKKEAEENAHRKTQK